jgi:hypothetical protein
MLNLVGSVHRPNLPIFEKYVEGLKDLATHKVLFSAKKKWYIQALHLKWSESTLIYFKPELEQ